MSKYRLNGTIYCDIEVEANSEEEAVKLFKAEHSYQHDSGMNVSPTVEEVEKVEEEELKGQVSVFVGHSKIMYFDMDSLELIICLRDKTVGIPSHRVDDLWPWILQCENYQNEINEDELKDLNL